MKLLMTTVAALSIATAAGAVTDVDSAALGSGQSADPAMAPALPAQIVLAQSSRYRDKCQEDLGYGRTGSYGCG
jgi:hypothetical protein